MIIEIVGIFVTVVLTLQEIAINPRRILERLHISNGTNLRIKPARESKNEIEEESELPVWDLFDDEDL